MQQPQTSSVHTKPLFSRASIIIRFSISHTTSSAQDNSVAATAVDCLMCVRVDVFLLVTAQHVGSSSSKRWTVLRASHVLSTTTNSSSKLHPNAYYTPGTCTSQLLWLRQTYVRRSVVVPGRLQQQHRHNLSGQHSSIIFISDTPE